MFNTSSLHLCLLCLKVVAFVATLPMNPAAPAKKTVPATAAELPAAVEPAPAAVHFQMPVSL
jgi:hypothetical protein